MIRKFILCIKAFKHSNHLTQSIFICLLLRFKKKKRLPENDTILEGALDLGRQTSLAEDEEFAMQLLSEF